MAFPSDLNTALIHFILLVPVFTMVSSHVSVVFLIMELLQSAFAWPQKTLPCSAEGWYRRTSG